MVVSHHVAGTVKVVLNWQGPSGTKGANVFHMKVGAGGDPTNSTELAAIAQAFFTNLQGTGSVCALLIANPWITTSIVAYDNSGASSNFGSSTNNLTGSVTGGSCPPNVAFVTSWRILESFKGGHPRTYWPGVPVSALAAPGSNQISNAFYANANTSVAQFQSGLEGGTIGGISGNQLGCIRSTGTGGVRFVHFQTFIHNFRVDSQRRRLGK